MKRICIIWLFILLSSCSNEVERVEKGYVHSNEVIGWTIVVPSDWTLTKMEQEESSNDSTNVSKQSNSENLDNYLFSFEKDEFNMFQSSVEPFKEDYNGEWIQNVKGVKQLLCDVYSKEGIKMDTTATISTQLVGKEFLSYETRLYANDGTLKLSQIFYSTLQNNHDFTICLNYNSPDYREELIDILSRSRFY
ncbi:MAG: hypothetical protein AB8B53_06360 [Flavobacteriales bacterium]